MSNNDIENNVNETKTKKEQMMKTENVEVEKESNVILSKLTEEQSNWLREHFHWDLRFDGFYPTLNTDLLTKIRESGKMFEFLTDDGLIFFIDDYGSVSHSMEDQLISIVKDYGSVSHSLKVDGEMTYEPTDLSEYLNFDISAEKIEEIGVDEIKKWGVGGYGFVRLEENLKSHSMMDEYPSGLEDYVINDSDFNPADSNDFYVSGVRVITTVYVDLPRPDVFAEKEVDL